MYSTAICVLPMPPIPCSAAGSTTVAPPSDSRALSWSRSSARPVNSRFFGGMSPPTTRTRSRFVAGRVPPPVRRVGRRDRDGLAPVVEVGDVGNTRPHLFDMTPGGAVQRGRVPARRGNDVGVGVALCQHVWLAGEA